MTIAIPMFKILIIFIIIFIAKSFETENCPQIKLKHQWGGKPGVEITYQSRPIRYVIIHHTVTDECFQFIQCASILRNIQNYYLSDLKYHDIGYNFMIGNDGIVYEGTGWGVIGAHTYGYNTNGTGISFIGNFNEKLPSEMALTAAKNLLACGVKQAELDSNYKLLGGLQVIATESPGLALYNEIQNWNNWSRMP